MASSSGEVADAQMCLRTYGEKLVGRFPNLRINSVGNLVVPVDSRPPFLLGVESTLFGLIVDLHCPFLKQVPGRPLLHELVAMNINLCPFGSVRVVPEDQGGSTYALELRHQVHAQLLTQDWLFYYADAIPRIGSNLIDTLRPALGGVPILSS